MQKILEIVSTKKFRNIFCFILFSALMTITVSSQNYFFQRIIENGVSKEDIVAQKDIKVIDTLKTESHKREVARLVEPILTQSGDDYITTSLEELKTSVIKIKLKNENNNAKREELNTLFTELQNKDITEYLLKARISDVNELFDKASIALTGVLNTGISSKDFDNDNVNQIIRKNIPNSTRRSQINMVIHILNQIIVPNLVVDDFATDIARKNAQNAVKPYEVVFKKGQTIIKGGDRINQIQKDALKAAGYNILRLNFGGIFGIFVLVSFFTFIFLQYEKIYEKDYCNERYLTITATFTLLLAFIATLLPTGFSPYIVPIPAYTMLLSIFTTPRNAFFASSILIGFLAMGMHYSIEVIVTFLLLNTVVATSISKLKFSKRSDLIITGLKITGAGILLVGGIYFIEKYMMEIDNVMIEQHLKWMFVNCFVISGVFILGILPIIENVFKVLTPYGLIELADHNQPLLKKLLSDAPGTFNHSLIVSHLAEAAAEAINANPVLARVGAMYHDIGKLLRPMFFVENQSFYGIENPHKSCTPRFSKMLITAHPNDGIGLAKDYHLPQIIHNFIIQHHGTSLVSYFYNEALKEEGEENVNEEQFRYPGPKPNMKETAILMLADAVESAVRAAKNPSNEEIDTIIQKIIKERLNDGQLEESPLTLKDLKTIAETFSKMLRGMHHKRIKYHDELVEELDKNIKYNKNDETQNGIPIIQQTLDADLESKIKELEEKKNGNN